MAQPLPGRPAQLKMAPSFRPETEPKDPYAKAGVMILLYPNQSDLSLVLIKRPEYEGVHSAQISFPGGKFEQSDPDLIFTALRETEEEVGVPSANIDFLGTLTSLYIPVSEIEVFPSVGYAIQKPSFKIDPAEVDYLIEVSLKDLMNPAILHSKKFSNIKYQGEIPYYDVQDNHVWGATAMILSEFMEIVQTLIATGNP